MRDDKENLAAVQVTSPATDRKIAPFLNWSFLVLIASSTLCFAVFFVFSIAERHPAYGDIFYVLISAWVTSIFIKKVMPNQSPDPTLASGAPPAEQESRLP